MTPPADIEKPFSFAVIPDTQNLVRDAPELYGHMTSWIAANAGRLGIEAVVHLGDVINGRAPGESQFRLAARAHRTILDAGIRLLVASGNHDYDDMEAQRGLALFNRHVGYEALRDQRCFDATFEPDAEENCYATVDHDDERLIFVLMEYLPRPEVVAWADQVLAAHRDRAAIVVTHALIGPDAERTTNGTDRQLDGEQLWATSLRRHPNLLALFCGHKVRGQVAYRVDLGDHGNAVLTSFQNWQMVDRGGEGRIRVVHVTPSTREIRLTTVNTATGQTEHLPGYDLAVTLDAASTRLRHPTLDASPPTNAKDER